MVNLQKSGDRAVKFVFTDSDHYLYGNGEIEVPVNSLLLVIDESDMVTFKKLSGDPFLSFRADNSNLGTKEAIEQFYKDNMVGSTGGGSESGITSGEVQTMIDNSLEDYYTDDEVDAALSGKASVSDVTAVNDALTAHTANTTVHVTQNEKNTWNGKVDEGYVSDYAYSKNQIDGFLSNAEQVIATKADTSALTAVNGALTTHTADTTVHVSQAEKATWNAKADASAITSSITSGSTDSEIPTAKATYDAIQAGGGGGATYSAGTNISIDTANTINCTLNLRNGSGNAIIIGDSNTQASGNYSLAVGTFASANRNNSLSVGQNVSVDKLNSQALGRNVSTLNENEFGCGKYNNSVKVSNTFGDSGNTLFSVGNGTTATTHNAFEIRQNGDIYVNDGTNDVRLQDTILALGGLKLVKLTQAEYDQLATKDPDTLYIISNVVA